MAARNRHLLTPDAERALTERARAGDRAATSRLFESLQPPLRDLVRRLVGHPDDTDDIVQDALIEGVEGLAEPSDERLADGLDAAALRGVLAFLAERRRWRVAAQIEAQSSVDEQGLAEELLDLLHDDDFQYDVREHVAFCFACVTRALPLEQHVAVNLVDVVGMDLARAAALTAADEERLQKYLTEGRQALGGLYDRLCRLSNDEGACDQCRGLRDAAAPTRKGPEIDGPGGVTRDLRDPIPEARLTARVKMVRAANLDRGGSRKLHDQLFRLIDRTEQNRTTPAKKDDEIPPGRARWESLQESNN